MSRSYIECPDCGKRALRIATRCPHCGREFLSPVSDQPFLSVQPSARRSVPLGAVLGAAVVVALTLGGWWLLKIHAHHVESTPVVVAATTPDLESDSLIAADSIAPSPGEQRFARTWTNVRTRRSRGADVAAVLLPGDTVLVDSLQHGWWRATLDGQVVGYVHRSTLQDEPPK